MRTAVRLSAFDLTPGPGLTRPADGPPSAWVAASPRAAFTLDAPLPAGWYRLRVRLRMTDRFAVRKRAELFADDTPVEAFAWNDRLADDLFVRLPRPAARLRLTLAHADGLFHLDRFDLRRVSAARAAARAVRLKLRLVTAYNCFWPVVARGGRLLARGDVRAFGRKLLKGIPDARTMRVEVKRAAEASAAWWRRRTASVEQLAAWRAEADALPDPPPIAVLIPADPTRTDHARQALLSVFRQVYPHWECVLAWPTARVPDVLASVAKWDARARVVTPPAGERGLAAAVRAALAGLRCDRVLVLPPDWEITEHGLLRFAQAAADPTAVVGCAAPDAATDASLPAVPAVAPAARLRAAVDRLAPAATAVGVMRWAAAAVGPAAATVPEPLLFPLDASSLLGKAGMTRPAPASARPLVLSADIRGLSGWDYVAFATLKGLHSLGVEVRRHNGAQVFPDLLPPGVRPDATSRTAADPQLVIAPPFLAGRFVPDARTAVLTMWEADRITPAEAAILSRAGVVIVPSRWGADCFRASGVTAPIEVVPLGYDPLVFHPGGAEPFPPTPSPKRRGGAGIAPSPLRGGGWGRGSAPPCVFGTAGALSAGGLRKNVRRVVDLFRRAFPAEPDVRLRVKITPNCPPFEVPDDERIEVVRATLPHADLAAWNRSLTAYVNASFAEGFGFHLLEAMACGVPLISTAYSGPTAFFDEAVGYVVPHRLVEARNEVYRGRWADPDDDAIIAAMRRVYHDREEARRLGEAAAARARRFTWRDTGRQLTAVLERYGLV